MSNNDSFIDEVSEEVRRERLFGLLRRYGWIVALLIVLVVGGAAYNEWLKAQDRAEAEALGDAMLSALDEDAPAARAEALDNVAPAGPGSDAILTMMSAAEALQSDPAAASERLMEVARMGDIPLIYRQIATLKAVMIDGSGMEAEARRARLEELALGGGVIRLMAEEQLAYLDIDAGQQASAIERMNAISADAEATAGLRRRATQVIVALGGEPMLPGGAEASAPVEAGAGAPGTEGAEGADGAGDTGDGQ